MRLRLRPTTSNNSTNSAVRPTRTCIIEISYGDGRQIRRTTFLCTRNRNRKPRLGP